MTGQFPMISLWHIIRFVNPMRKYGYHGGRCGIGMFDSRQTGEIGSEPISS
jgi:hypothetical protein